MVTISDRRGTGRTAKALALVASDPEACLITINKDLAEWTKTQKPDCKDRIFSAGQIRNGALRGRNPRIKRAYLDDWELQPAYLAQALRDSLVEVEGLVLLKHD